MQGVRRRMYMRIPAASPHHPSENNRVEAMMMGGEVVCDSRMKGGRMWNWIILDSSGQETVVDIEKNTVMQRVQLYARDLRILDPLLTYPSTILVRQGAIILNLEHIKAIITSEEVLVRDPMDENVIPIVEELRRRLKHENGNRHVNAEEDDAETAEDDSSPFEFRVLEVALEAICSSLSARALELSSAVYPALDMLMSKINGRNLDRVRKLKSRMTRLTTRVQKVRDEVEQLLEDDDDMANFYLSRKLGAGASPMSWLLTSPANLSKAGRASTTTHRGDDRNDVKELEMLLEAYFTQIDATLNDLNMLREYIDNTEIYINTQLDTRRNQLIQLELFLNAAIVCLALYSLVAAIFGMNIPYSWMNDHGYMFKWVVICSGLFCTVLFILIICYARSKGLVVVRP